MAGATGTAVVTVEAPREATRENAPAVLHRTESGLVDGPVSDLIETAWQGIEERSDLLGEPLAALVSAGVLVNDPPLGLEFQWLVTRERTQLLRFTQRSEWSVLGERSSEPHGDSAVLRACQQQLRVLVTRDADLDGGWFEPLSPSDPLAQRWPLLHSRLSARRKLELEPSFESVPTVASLMNVSVAFITEQPKGELRVVAVTSEHRDTFAPQLFVDSRQLVLGTDAWSLSSGLPSTSITPWLNWTIDYVDAGRRGAELPTGYVAFDDIDPLRQLYRERDEPRGQLTVGLSKVHLRYVLPAGSKGAPGLEFELLLVDGRIKINGAKETSQVPNGEGLAPEAAAMFQPIADQLRDGDYKALVVTPADIASMERFVNRSASSSALLKLATAGDLAKLRRLLRSVPREGGRWYVGETQHVARAPDGRVYGIEVDVEGREHMLVETQPLFRIQKVSDPSP